MYYYYYYYYYAIIMVIMRHTGKIVNLSRWHHIIIYKKKELVPFLSY